MANLIADPFQTARLVLSLRRQGITHDGVISAIETVDRGAFVDEAYAEIANEDCTLPIGCGQSMSRPILIAHLFRALDPSPGKDENALLVGAGSGYSTALLSQVSRHVFAVERYDTLAVEARERLNQLNVENVDIRHGDGLLGWPERGPFDGIVLMGAVNTVPLVLVEQLKPQGRLVAVVSGANDTQMLRVFQGKKMLEEIPFPSQLPMLSKGLGKAL